GGAQLTWPENPDILDATSRLEESTTLGAWAPSPLVTTWASGESTTLDGRGGDRFFHLASTTAYGVDPTPIITCWGDSLTGNAGTYVDKLPAALALAGSTGRVTQQGGIGGDISSQILDRMRGLYVSAPFPPIAGDTPTATRVIASRTTHSRIMNSANYRGQWATYAATIANVSRVEFFNFGRKIGESSTPLTATVTSNRAVNAARFLAAGHPFENGFVVHFPTGPLPSPLVVGKTYYVRDVTSSAFSLVEADTLVTVTASSAAPSTRYVAAGHPFANGDAVYFPFGGAQAGFVAERYYYVRDADAGGFSLADTVGGPAISMIYNFGPANIKGPLGAPVSLNADFAAPRTLQGPFVLNWSHPGGPTALTLRTHTDRDANTLIFWLGRNNNARPHETYAHLHAAVEHIKALNGRFLIVSVTNGANESAGSPYYYGTIGLNWLLKQEFPNEFIDVRTALIRAASNSTQYQNDRVADIPPTSLRSDNIHFNDAGQQIIANILAAELVRRGW
ncbi:MAG: hypothetical protein ACOYMN_03820, partial [Roseimicrobium sp.]